MRSFAIAVTLFFVSVQAHAETFPIISDPIVVKECGDCHMAFPPETMTKAVWRDVMAKLSDHYGEDASLDATTTKHILAYHEAHASDVSESRAAMKWTAETAFNRITEGPRFKDKHSGCSQDVWNNAQVKSKSNCEACHKTMQRTGSTDADLKFLPKSLQAQCNELGSFGVMLDGLF